MATTISSLEEKEAKPKRKGRRVLFIGLDCAPPELLFDKYKDDLPNISRLAASGIWGELESSHPPITVPAWASMLSGQDAGQLGVYGFRNRADYSYSNLAMANASSIKTDRVWDILSRSDRKVCLVGVPQTYPIRETNGVVVSCFLTPSIDSQYTHPPELRHEIAGLVGEYMLDVHNFRTDDKHWLLSKIYEMTRKRFSVVRHLMSSRPWDFFMFVEIGTDRLHHGFWKYMDQSHRKYEKGNPFETAIKDYYKYVDSEIGSLLQMIDDDTVVCIASDHGAKKMEGGICINEWLIQNGYLKLKSKPGRAVPISECEIDWSSTLAWSEGGYYARVFMNVKGREPQGVIEPENYETIRNELAAKIAAIPDEKGRPMATHCYRPEELYRSVNGIAPDLIVYFGDLDWRSVGSVGTGKIHTFDNDTGADDANHAQMGVFIMYDPRNPGNGRHMEGLKLTDVAPTLLKVYGLEIPPGMIGSPIA